MKKTITILLIVVFAVLLIGAALVFPKLSERFGETDVPPSEAESLEPAPDFTVYDAEGNAVKLSDFTGKPSVVNFWATWCGHCVNEMPGFNAVYEDYKDSVNFLMLDQPDGTYETQEIALAYVEEQGYTFPVYFDTDYDAAETYSVSGIPTTLLVDKDGMLYRKVSGEMKEATLRQYLDALTQPAE